MLVHTHAETGVDGWMLTLQSKPSVRTDRVPVGRAPVGDGLEEAAGVIGKEYERPSSEAGVAAAADGQREPLERVLVWWERCEREWLRGQHHGVDEA